MPRQQPARKRYPLLSVIRKGVRATPTPTPTPTATPTPPVPHTVVISQVYGGGGNSGSTYKNDFFEIHNTSSLPVDLNGWSVQWLSTSAGATWQSTALTGSIGPGQYYLVQEGAGAGGTT